MSSTYPRHVAAPRARRVTAAVLSLVAMLGSLAAPTSAAADIEPPPRPLIEGPVSVDWPAAPEVAAPVHLLVDAVTGQVLSAEGADERRPVASTVKILTALTAAANADLAEEIEIGPEVLDVPGASVELLPGERWTVEELLEGIMVRSGNDAAIALATGVGGDTEGFVELMRRTARQLGLRVGASGVEVTSPSGLDDDQRFTARDLATLTRVLLADADLRAIVGAEEVALPGREPDENRNLLIGDYPGATGVKTGYTEASGNSVVASARRDGRELIAIVLGGGPDPERFRDAATLLDHGFEAFESRELAAEVTLLVAGGTRTILTPRADVVVPARVDVGFEIPIPIRPPDAGSVPVPVRLGARQVATVAAEIDPPREAPTGDGAGIGHAVAEGVYAALRADHVADSAQADPV